jgi:hypothetical protein
MVAPYANPQRSAGRRGTTTYIPDNGYVERLIGSIRRECLNHIVILGERHLQKILCLYADYHNNARTHLSFGKDAPIHRPPCLTGAIVSLPILGGLHHQYVRA